MKSRKSTRSGLARAGTIKPKPEFPGPSVGAGGVAVCCESDPPCPNCPNLTDL